MRCWRAQAAGRGRSSTASVDGPGPLRRRFLVFRAVVLSLFHRGPGGTPDPEVALARLRSCAPPPAVPTAGEHPDPGCEGAASAPDAEVADDPGEGADEQEAEGEPAVDRHETPPPARSGGARGLAARLASRGADGLAQRVPPAVRGGVVDPGRRAVGALALVGVVAAFLAAAYLWRSQPHPVTVPTRVPAAASMPPGASAPPGTAMRPLSAPSAAESPTATPETVVVDVGGKVREPGVHTLPAGSRVVDAVEAAGGLEPGADTTGINLARQLVDGEKILVDVPRPPQLGGPRGTSPGAAPAQPGEKAKIDLNTATAERLTELPGIGEVLAQRIVDYRTEHGGFGSVAELENVSGIGPATMSDLRDKVRV